MKANDLNDYALPFAAWELRLYLDTHPNDERALAAYRQLCSSQGRCTYACHTPNGWKSENHVTNTPTGSCRACNGAMLTASASPCHKSGQQANRWTWIDDPWPWELEANMIGGNC